MARRERASGIDIKWIGAGYPFTHREDKRVSAEVIEDDDRVLFYAVEEDGTVSTYWAKDRIGFVR